MVVSLNVGQLAYTFAITCTALSAYLVFKLGLTSRDAAQRNAQFRSLQLHFLIPYLAILLAESIQVSILFLLFRKEQMLSTGVQYQQLTITIAAGIQEGLTT
uniref:Uncharacterized protein n=1 Tax=Parascaris equorum TaxID=6256 RepID=A0A914S1N8_PAREQ